MNKTIAVALCASLVSLPAIAQPVGAPGQAGTVIQTQPNTTGNDRDVVISRGATGAETVTTDSAAGGNASRPEQAVPNSSAGGGSGVAIKLHQAKHSTFTVRFRSKLGDWLSISSDPGTVRSALIKPS